MIFSGREIADNARQRETETERERLLTMRETGGLIF